MVIAEVYSVSKTWSFEPDLPIGAKGGEKMKVTGNNEILPSVLPDKQSKSTQSPAESFDAILKEKIETSPKPASSPTTAFLNPIPPIQNLSISHPLSPPDREITSGRVENLFDLLDDYRQKLADPQVTLKEIDALIGRISGEKENLTATLSSMEKGEQLQDILNQTLVTASLEVMKFRRGDYLDS